MQLLILASVLLVACNQVYGLDQTHERDAFMQFDDADQDGIADTIDNCKFVANFDQHDDDIDKIGDACDGCDHCPTCTVGPNHDEDGDHIADGCDPCPAIKEVTDDSDGDRIGDACEHASAAQRRILFDGFAEMSPDWIEIGARWDVADDVVTTKSGEPGSFEYLHAPTMISGTDWAIETTIRPPTGLGHPVGIRLTSTIGVEEYLCLVGYRTDTVMQLLNGQLIEEFPPLPSPITLRLVANNPVGGGHELVCSIRGTTHQVKLDNAGGANVNYPVTLRFFAELSGTAYEYVDVIAP